MSRRQSLVIFVLSAFIASIVLSISILMISPNDESMPTLAALDAVASPPLQHYAASEYQPEKELDNQFIVQFNDDVNDRQDIETLVAEIDADWIDDIPQIQGAVIQFENTLEVEQLETLSSALVIEPNYIVQSLSNYPTNDPMLPYQWAWQKIDIPRLWDETDLESEVIIAVIDSGVCFSHPDLQGRFLENGYDFVDSDDDPSDQMGHGCAISGIIAANLDNGIGMAGIAPNVKILPLRVLDAEGVGTYANVMSAIFYAVDNGADIINLSLGGQNYSQLLEQAIDYAVDHGIQVVAGSGNTGQEGVLYPARYKPVIAVGSYNVDGNRSSFSTYGDEVDVLAPGENIVSTRLNGDYATYSGTSMAAPHISALLALSNGSLESIDFDDMMSTPHPTPTENPTADYVQALMTATATPTILAPTNTRPAATYTPSPFQCSDLRLTNVQLVGNRVNFKVLNGGSTIPFQSIDVHYTGISAFPDMYLSSLSYDTEVFWVGDNTYTSPVYVDETVLSTGGIDFWPQDGIDVSYNEETTFQAQFLSSPTNLIDYWTIEDLTGTTLSFYNPASPTSPCTLIVPGDIEGYIPPSPVASASPTADYNASNPPYPECGSTDIELAYIGDHMITYRVENVSSATDSLANMSHSYISPNLPVSGTIQISSIYHNADFIWAGIGGRDTIDEGTWLSSPYLDDDLITIYYNTNFPIDDYYDPEDFDTEFHVFSTIENGYCTIHPTINYQLLELPIACGTDMWFNGMTSNSISFRIADTSITQDEITSIYHSLSQNQWYPVSATIALDSIEIDGHTLWTGPENLSVSTSVEGIWSPYTTLDDNLITFNYDTSTYGYSLDMTKYFDVSDFSTFFHLHNIYSNQTCAENPDKRDYAQPLPVIHNISHTNDSATLEWIYAGTATDYIIEAQEPGMEWITLAQVPNSTTAYEDTAFQCSLERRYRVTAYDSNTDTYSQPSLPFDQTILPCTVAQPTNLTITSVASGTHLNWQMTDEDYDFVRIYRQISGVNSSYLPIDYVYPSDTTYLDPVDFYCDSSVSYQIQSGLQSPSGQYVYSDFVTAELTPTSDHCINLLPPTDFTATRVDDGVQLSWTPANDIQNYFFIDRMIVGVDTDFSQVNYTSLATYKHQVNYECDTTQVDYRIRSRHYHSQLGWRYSDPVIVRYSEICPHTDLELELTVDNLSPEPYTPVVVTLTVRNTGDELARNLYITQHTVGPYLVIDSTATTGEYSSYWHNWRVNVLPAHSEETVVITLLAQQDKITGEQSFAFEILESNAIDPDSVSGNGDLTEDDYASVTLGMQCPASNDVFDIADGDTDALARAIALADYESCFPGSNTVNLAQSGYYPVVKSISGIYYGYTGDDQNRAFSPITTDLIIEGNNATIEQTSGPVMRAFQISDTANVEVHNLKVAEFNAGGGQSMGAAFYNEGQLTLDTLQIERNSATIGAAIYTEGIASVVNIYNSNIDLNDGYTSIIQVGEDSHINIVNSTISKQSATNILLIGTADIRFSTFYYAGATKALYLYGENSHVTLFGNLMYVYNNASSCETIPTTSSSKVTSLGYNWSRRCSFSNPTDIHNGEVTLGSLQYNGGFTKTFALLDGDAVDVIPAELCSVSRDQNGAYRPQDNDNDNIAACNVGAYESESQIVLNLQVDNNAPHIGDTITLNMELINTSLFDAADVTVNLGAPDGMIYLGAISSTAGTIQTISGTQQWVLPLLTQTATETARLQYRVDGPFAFVNNVFDADLSLTHLGSELTDHIQVIVTTECEVDSDVYYIADGDVEGLANAIRDANSNTCELASYEINLAADGDYVFQESYGDPVASIYSRSLLPFISSDITINGNRSTLRSNGASGQLVHVEDTGSLTLNSVTVRDFFDTDSHRFMIRSYGDLSIVDTEIVNNDFEYLVYGNNNYGKYVLDRIVVWNNFNSNQAEDVTTVHLSSAYEQSIVRNSTIVHYNESADQYTMLYINGNYNLEFNTFYNSQHTTARLLQTRNLSSSTGTYFGNIYYDVLCSMLGDYSSAGYNITNFDRSFCKVNHANDISSSDAGYTAINLYSALSQPMPKKVLLPFPGSLGMDLIPPEACTLDIDQRGLPRPVGINCDAGAAEVGNTIMAPTDTQAITDFDSQLVTISWTDNSSDETGFRILRKGSNETEWNTVGDVPADITEFNDTEVLNCSQTYDYVVYAFENETGFSLLSPEATTINFSCVELVKPSLNVIAVSQTSIPDIVVDLIWVDTNINLTGWHVEQRVDGGVWESVATVNSSSELQHTLVCETDNDFRVQAYREDDDVVSNWSNIVSFVAGNCPEPPIFASITGTGFNQIDATFASYTPSDALIQIKYRKANSTDNWQLKYSDRADQLSALEFTGLICGTEYEFRSQATVDTITPNQLSEWTTVTAFTQDCVPLDPPTLSLTPISTTDAPGTDVILSWVDTNGDGTNWLIEYRKDEGAWAELTKLSGSPSLSQYLECESSYEYRILAFQGEMDAPLLNTLSEWSTVVSYTTDECLSKPVILSAEPYQSDKIRITFDPQPGINRRTRLYRKLGSEINDDPWDDITTSTNSYNGQVNSYLPSCGLTYQFRIREHWNYDDQTYYSDYSDIVVATAYECLTPPTNLTSISSTEDTITFGWENTTARTDYETIIFNYDEPTGTWDEIDRIPTSQTEYTVSCSTSSTYRLQLYHPVQDEYSPSSDPITVNGGNCIIDDPQLGPTFTVTTTDDLQRICGVMYCSLRAAIEASNNMSGANTIYLPDGVYLTQVDGVYEDDNRTGDYDILDDLTILGNASGTTIIDANKIDRLFDVDWGISFSIDNVTLQNSNDTLWHSYQEIPGGLIFADHGGDIVVSNSILQNAFGYSGGAIHIESGDTLTINNAIFRNNTSDSWGGAVYAYYVDTVITDSLFEYNQNLTNHGGAITQHFDTISIYNSIFRHNVSGGNGGAVATSDMAVVDDSLFTNNEAVKGGAIYIHDGQIKNSAVINNKAVESGGGLYLHVNTQIENVTISGNTAGVSGGGIFDFGDNIIKHATIVNNQALSGGGIYFDNHLRYPTMYNSLVANNMSNVADTEDCYVENGTGTIGNSLIESTNTCNLLDSVSDSVFGIDPPLSDLQSAFGTYYYLPLAGNPAINNASGSECLSLDQLGHVRPIGIQCDMGAIESEYLLNPPTNLTAINSEYSYIQLTWQDNSLYEEGITVERSLDGNDWDVIVSLPPNTTTFTDTTSQCPEDYYYRVRIGTNGYTETSSEIFASVSAPCEALTFVYNPLANFTNETIVQVQWSDDNSDESSYRIMRRVTGTWSEIGVVAPDLTTYYDSTIDCNTDLTYDYQIQAYRDIDGDEALSNSVSVWTGNCPFIQPNGFNPSTVTDEEVVLSWNDNSILETNYVLSRKAPKQNWIQIASLASNTTTYTDTNLECERQYQYELQGYQSLFDRYTDPITTTLTTGKCIVESPSNISTTVTFGETSINWNPIPAQQTTQIIVERAAQETEAVVSLSLNWQVRATLSGGMSAFTDDDVRCGMIYAYRLQGYNERYDEYSAYSDIIQFETDACPVPVTNTIGLYHEGRWIFREGFEGNASEITFRFGPQEAGWIPLTGDWDGDGVDGIGIYKDGLFALRDISSRGATDYVYRFGNTNIDWQPIVGDWNGDGVDTVGLYHEGQFILTDSNTEPSIDYRFRFGKIESGWQPIAGDWFKYGHDDVGVYKDGKFNLHHNFQNSSSGTSVLFGAGDGWQPIAGDWDADGYTTIGLYKDSSWRLTNDTENRRTVDIGIRFDYFNGQGYPLASYRGGDEPLEALALFVDTMDININDVSQPQEVTATIEPTMIPTDVSTVISPTEVEVTPTIVPISGTEVVNETITPTLETTVEPSLTITPTWTPEPSWTPTMIPTNTPVLPTATILPTVEPTQTEQPMSQQPTDPEATEEPVGG